MMIHDAGGTATKTAPFLVPAGLNPLFAYMASDAGAMRSMTTYSVARGGTDQRLANMEPNPNSANGDRTQTMMRTSRNRGVVRPARTVNSAEPTAPINAAIQASDRSKPRTPPALGSDKSEVISPADIAVIEDPSKSPVQSSVKYFVVQWHERDPGESGG
jgi:hypothetical protein